MTLYPIFPSPNSIICIYDLTINVSNRHLSGHISIEETGAEAAVGEAATLTCKIKSLDKVADSVTWITNGGVKLITDTDYTVNDGTFASAEQTTELTIAAAKETQNFYCSAQEGTEVETHMVKLQVYSKCGLSCRDTITYICLYL